MSAPRWRGVFAWIKRHWGVIRKVLTGCFVALILTLLGMAVVEIDWREVLAAIHKLPGRALWLAALITAASYTVYSSFDLLGKWYTEHGLAWWRTMMVGFISYAFTMSMGAPVGGLGLRLRLYAKQGLQQGVIMRVMGLSLTTNWMGYTLLAGAIFAAGMVELPPGWKLDNGPLRLIGAAMVAAGCAYLGLCAFSRTRSWTVLGHEIELPSIGMAALQISLAILNWMLIGAVIYVLLQQRIAYPMVLGALLIGAIAGALAHIPGGIGVIESVFIALLGASMGRAEILGSLLVYRAIYYLAPLLLAGTWYLATEVKMRKFARHANCSPK
ncbi:MAG: lysylphosphatidylglycerol synthase transmembrane domain-containing protein [Pollutimonas bauzanensis]